MKRILTICLALLVVAGSAFATKTRLLTLGQQFDIVMDQANIFRYPSRLLNYPKLAVAEFGYLNSDIKSLSDAQGTPTYTAGEEFKDFGIHWQFSSGDNAWVLGTYFHNAEVEGGVVNFPGSGLSYDYAQNDMDNDLLPNRRIDLFWSKMMGGNPFGVHFGWVHSSQSDEFDAGTAGTFKESEGFNKYKLGLGLTMNGGNTDVALAFELWSLKDESSALNGGTYETFDETESDGNYQIMLNFRHFMPKPNNYTLVPHAMFGYQKSGWKYNDFDTTQVTLNTDNTNIMSAGAGAGLNWTPTSDVLALLDVGISYAHFSFKDTDDPDGTTPEVTKEKGTELALFYFKAGAEATIFPWMTGRLGATTNWNFDSYNPEMVEGNDGETFKAKYSSNDTYLGFGFLWGGWHIDTYVDPAWLLNGPYFLTGESNSMNWQISVLRPFE